MLKAKGIKLLTVKIALEFQNMCRCMAVPFIAFCFLLTFAAIYKKWYRNLMLE